MTQSMHIFAFKEFIYPISRHLTLQEIPSLFLTCKESYGHLNDHILWINLAMDLISKYIKIKKTRRNAIIKSIDCNAAEDTEDIIHMWPYINIFNNMAKQTKNAFGFYVNLCIVIDRIKYILQCYLLSRPDIKFSPIQYNALLIAPYSSITYKDSKEYLIFGHIPFGIEKTVEIVSECNLMRLHESLLINDIQKLDTCKLVTKANKQRTIDNTIFGVIQKELVRTATSICKCTSCRKAFIMNSKCILLYKLYDSTVCSFDCGEKNFVRKCYGCNRILEISHLNKSPRVKLKQHLEQETTIPDEKVFGLRDNKLESDIYTSIVSRYIKTETEKSGFSLFLDKFKKKIMRGVVINDVKQVVSLHSFCNYTCFYRSFVRKNLVQIND
jgi:hypothetical protein